MQNKPPRSVKQLRLLEIKRADHHRRRFLLDHHAGNAWYSLWQFIESGCAPDHTSRDNKRMLAQRVLDFPSALRERLDPCFFILRAQGDPLSFQPTFDELEQQWRDTLGPLLHLPSNAAENFRLIREVAKQLVPKFVEWFERLRDTTCGGGEALAWGWG